MAKPVCSQTSTAIRKKLFQNGICSQNCGSAIGQRRRGGAKGPAQRHKNQPGPDQDANAAQHLGPGSALGESPAPAIQSTQRMPAAIPRKQKHRQNLEDKDRKGPALGLQPKRVQKADLRLTRLARVIDQFPDHRGADEGNRHRHEDHRLRQVAPADAVGQLRGQQAKRGRAGRHDDQPDHVVAQGFPELRLAEHAAVIVHADKDQFARPVLVQRKPQRRKDRIGQVKPKPSRPETGTARGGQGWRG
jgi:hypothetical protein